MPSALPRASLRLASVLLLQGCLVSFNDYPLGGNATTSAGSGTGATTAKAGSGGQAGGTGRGGDAGEPSSDAGEPSAGGSAPTSAVAETWIDDFEDADSAIFEHAGREGAWYAANDGQGLQNPAHGMAVVPTLLNQARGESRRAIHTSGGPMQDWGALIGTSLASAGDEGAPYDVTAYQGVRFWVRSTPFGPGFTFTGRINFPVAATNEGGGCFVCGDHYGADFPLTQQWVQHEVRFSELEQAGWGTPVSNHDLENITSIQFAFREDVRFDLWVDDIEFF